MAKLPDIVVTPGMAPIAIAELQKHFAVTVLAKSGRADDTPGLDANSVRAIASPGVKPGCVVNDAFFAQFPNLEIVSCFSSGVDGIDTKAAAARGVAITHAPDVLAEPVADIALALALDVMRGVTAGDRYVRAGRWGHEGNMPLTTGLGGKTAGIVGLGRIGKAVVRRLVACGMNIAYHGRKPQPDSTHAYYKDVLDLALASDLLILSCPGTPETQGMITADVLRALGPKGFIVNVARGSVIDEAALIDALKSGALGGAGLDVTIGEPNPNPALTSLNNVVVLPHIGGAAAETRFAMYDVMIANLKCFFAGEPLPNRFDVHTIAA